MKEIIFKIASNKKILEWSNGEVTNSETLNYKTLKPEFGGLFCERIFGPSINYTCFCGKYKGIIYKNKKCEICGVEIIDSSCRRKRMGHIKLNALLVNSIYHKIYPSKLSILLNISSTNLDKIIYSENFVLIKNILKYKKYEIINSEKYEELLMEYGSNFFCKSGGEGILELLNRIDLKKTYKKKKKKLFKKNNKKNDILRFEIVKSFIKNKIKLSDLILRNIPVLPPGTRPLLELENGKFASSDLNELYRRLINRNNRIKNINSSFFSENIIIKEKKMLQESLDSLFCLGDSYTNFYRNYKKSLKSILENLKGKSGRFRQNLLGKRVDYSARSVIVSEPKLNINQCCIPLDILYELFKPFIIGILIKNYTKTIINSKKIFLSKSKLVINIIKKLSKKFKIILNRAPTLHRLGIQAFNIIITNDKAIKIHPLVCFSYNADFDGDQMAVHLPISEEANIEAKCLLGSEKNIFLPSNGKLSIFPNQEMILGLYIMTKRKNSKNIKYYSNIYQIINELKLNNNYNDSVFYIKKKKKYFTTYGRIYIYNKIIKYVKINFKHLNFSLKKDSMTNILYKVYKNNGKKKTILLIEKLMKIGFDFCEKLGFSISISDIKVSENIDKILKDVFTKNYPFYKKNKTNFSYKKFCKYWLYSLKKIHYYNALKINYPFNDILISGAKSNITQIKQIFSFKGIINKKTINIPLFNSFFRGLDTYQYFLSTHSARKGLVDTSLKTADSGYLTRRLINLCQGVIIKNTDCKTKNGIKIDFKKYDIKNIIGRYSIRDIFYKNKKIVNKNKPININSKNKIEKLNIKNIVLRSPIFCNVKHGLCSKCYGFDLSSDKLINIGEAVGIIAAQSIGEPGTQFTMRTFHIGGMAGEKELFFYKYSLYSGFIRYSQNLDIIKDIKNFKIVTSKKGYIYITDKNDNILQTINVSYGDRIIIGDGNFINKKSIVSESLRFVKTIFVSKNSYNFSLNKIYKNTKYKVKKINKLEYLLKILKIKKNFYLKIYRKNKVLKFNIKKNYYIFYRKNYKILKGDIFIFKDQEYEYIDNITNSIEKIENILELRIPKKKSYISEYNGILKIINKKEGTIKIGKVNITVKGKIIKKNNDLILKGDKITKGNLYFPETLNNKNLSYFACLVIYKIQKVYYEQGININNKHFEIVIKQMINKVIVTNNINEKMYVNKKIYRHKILKLKKNYPKLKYNNIAEGITKVSINNNPSFIASASFQETGKIVSESSLLCTKDKLIGLKENIIAGNLIPVGTGYIKK
ncbi:DNA-directed RNA polymerase subunit beta' [Candidatus Vidania fulgoroideorum]